MFDFKSLLIPILPKQEEKVCSQTSSVLSVDPCYSIGIWTLSAAKLLHSICQGSKNSLGAWENWGYTQAANIND